MVFRKYDVTLTISLEFSLRVATPLAKNTSQLESAENTNDKIYIYFGIKAKNCYIENQSLNVIGYWVAN